MRVKSLGYCTAQWLSNRLPSGCAFSLAERLADCRWRSSSVDRRTVQQNLAMLAGSTVSVGDARVREVFRNFGRYLVEFFAMHRVERPQVEVEGREHLSDARLHGRGAILLTAHVGNWEVAAVAIRRMGFPVAAVALAHDDLVMDRLFNAQRERCGIRVIPLGREAARRSLQSLRDGTLLGLLGDREFGDKGLTLSMFGGRVSLPRGPATLSVRAAVPLVPTFLIREGRWRFRLCLEPPIWPPAHGDHERAVHELTRSYAEILQRYLRRVPEQWLMFQPFASPCAVGTAS